MEEIKDFLKGDFSSSSSSSSSSSDDTLQNYSGNEEEKIQKRKTRRERRQTERRALREKRRAEKKAKKEKGSKDGPEAQITPESKHFGYLFITLNKKVIKGFLMLASLLLCISNSITIGIAISRCRLNYDYLQLIIISSYKIKTFLRMRQTNIRNWKWSLCFIISVFYGV